MTMWTCQRCTVQNASASCDCQVCGLPHGAATLPSQWWQCSHCCQFNTADSAVCHTCDRPAPAPLADTKGGAVSWTGTGSAGNAAGEREGRGRAAGWAGTECSGSIRPADDARRLPEDDTTKENREEATCVSGDTESSPGVADTETVWVCQKKQGSGLCNNRNGMKVYRCTQCDAVKPYLPHMLTLSQVSKVSGQGRRDHRRQQESSDSNRDPWIGGGGSQRQKATEHGSASLPHVDRAEQPRTPLPHSLSLPDSGEGRSPFPSAEQAASTSLQQLSMDDGHQGALPDGEVLGFPDSECRLVLVGKTGSGKSATANTILGLEQHFPASFHFNSMTRKCQRHQRVRFGIPVEVVDTPGLFDTDIDHETVRAEVTKCLGVIAPGPHAVLLVLRVGVRFTEEEGRAVDEVHRVFGVQLLRFLIVVFTHGDLLTGTSEADRDSALRAMLDRSPSKLKELLCQANRRYVLFDNTAELWSKQRQVKRLLTTVVGLLKVNGGRPFTSQLLNVMEGHMSDRETELRQQLGGSAGRRRASTDRTEKRFFRDMTREEVVQEKPLLQRMMKEMLPVLASAVGKILLALLVNKAAGRGCRLQ